jgi:hypothetical protein
MLYKPKELVGLEFKQFKKRAIKYTVWDRLLFRKEKKNISNRLVINSGEEQMKIVKALHDDSGHKRRESTYWKIADRYY